MKNRATRLGGGGRDTLRGGATEQLGCQSDSLAEGREGGREGERGGDYYSVIVSTKHILSSIKYQLPVSRYYYSTLLYPTDEYCHKLIQQVWGIIVFIRVQFVYSGTSNKGPSEIGTTSLHHANTLVSSEIGTISLQGTKLLA